MNNANSPPVINAESLLPARHPSAWMACGLGLGSLLLGPLLGAPALWFARKIRRELAAHTGRITGVFAVATGAAAAWTCCIAWSAALLTVLVAVQPATAYVLPLCGLVLAALLILRGGPRWLATMSMVGSIVAVFGGIEIRREALHAQADAQVQACMQAQNNASTAHEAHDFSAARSAYQRITSTCLGEEARTASRAMDLLTAQEEYERHASEFAAEELAAETARREAALQTVRLGEAERSVTTQLRGVRQLERTRRWDETATALRSIRATLLPFRSSGGERLNALSTEVGAIEDRIQPELENLRAREAAADRRKAAAERRREAAAEARRHAAEAQQERSWSSNRVRCCDGTLSPSCTYDYSLRGCCSHHGGVC